MEWNQIAGNWNHAKNGLQQKWPELSDEDLDRVDGKRDLLTGVIQAKYAISRDEAEVAVSDWQQGQTQYNDLLDPTLGFDYDDDLQSGSYLDRSSLESDLLLDTPTDLDSGEQNLAIEPETTTRLDSGDFATTATTDAYPSEDEAIESDLATSASDYEGLNAAADPAAEKKYNPDYTGADGKELIDDEGQPIDEGYGRSENQSDVNQKPGTFNPSSDKEHQEKSIDQT